MEINVPFIDKNRLLLEMLNPIIGNMTPKELKIITYLADNKLYKLDKNCRTAIRMHLDMDKFNFNNYLSKLKTKKILLLDKGFLNLNSKIIALLQNDNFKVNFV